MPRFLTRQFVHPPPSLASAPAGRRASGTALAHGLFFVASGLWPIVHYRSFERVTGPKVDAWLVKTTGALIAAVGAGLLSFARHDADHAGPARTLGVATSAALAASDVVYVARRRISPVYLIDAVIEAAWCWRWLSSRGARPWRPPAASTAGLGPGPQRPR